MKYAVAFPICGGLLAWLAIAGGGFGWLLLWPATSFLLVGAAYAGLGPGVFAKRPDGSTAVWSLLLLLPYRALAWSVWRLFRALDSHPPVCELLPGVFIGRRLLARELPAEIDHVFDLTCEFVEPAAIRRRTIYRAVPILDASAPDVSTLHKLLREIDRCDGNVYIHCAQGFGRTGTVAAALLLYRGLAGSVDEAVQLVGRKRSSARPRRAQHRFLERAFPTSPPSTRR